MRPGLDNQGRLQRLISGSVAGVDQFFCCGTKWSSCLELCVKGVDVAHVIAIIKEEGKRTTFTYDLVDRRKAIRNPLNQVQEFDYDAAGNLILKESPRGDQIAFEYDKTNRLLSRSYSFDGSLTTFSYDAVALLSCQVGWWCVRGRPGCIEICESASESQFGDSVWISSRIVDVRFRSLILRTLERRRDCFRCRQGCRWICRIRKILRRPFRECSRPVRILGRGRRCRRNRHQAAAVILGIPAIDDSLPGSRPVTAIPA